MGQVLEFPGQLPDDILIQWGPEFSGPRFIEFDLEGEDAMYSVSTSEGAFLFNIMIANGAIFVHNPDADYFRDFRKGEFSSYRADQPYQMAFNGKDLLVLDWSDSKPFLEYVGEETSIKVVKEPLPDGWMQFLVDLNSGNINTHRDGLSRLLGQALEDDNVFTAPFSVSEGETIALDKVWATDLYSTGLLVHPMNWTSHYMPGPESAIRMEIASGGLLTVISKIDTPMITVQINDGPEEVIHKDMLPEYLMRNV